MSIGTVSKLWPSSAVKVCAVLSSLATAIGPSPPTVSVAGLNAKLSILIALPEEDSPAHSGRFSVLRHWEDDCGPVDALWPVGVACSPVVAAM